MWRLYEQMKEDNVEPDMSTFNTLITFFAKSKEHSELERADALLQCMENSDRPDIQPDHRQFTPVIKDGSALTNRIKRRKFSSAASTAFCKTKNMGTAPNAIIMNMVMQGWIKAGDLERATLLIFKMLELKDGNLLPEGPNSRTLNSLLDAWSRSTHPAKSANMQRL